MAALHAVEVRNGSCITPRFNFLLGVTLLLLFPIRTFAADPTMTLLKRESQPISEGQTIIRSEYRVEPRPFAGVQMPPFTLTKEIAVIGCGVNYDVNRGAGQPVLAPSHAALAASTVAGVAFESTASPLEVYLPVAGDQWLVVSKNGRAVFSRFIGADAAAVAVKADDRTARYANVFPDTDLVWQVGNGYLKESLILRSRSAPTEFSILLESRDFTFLAPDATQKTFSLGEVTGTAQAMKVAGPMMLALVTAKDQHQILVPVPFVVDARGKRSRLDCFVARTPTGALLYTMRIPAGFLASRALTYPLTVDPSYYNVTNASPPLVYEAGRTYYISEPIYYTTQSVRVEANAFLKFHPWGGGGDAGSLNFTGSSDIHVEGTPYNYAYFTSGYDDTVGADTDGPTTSGFPLAEGNPSPGDYGAALEIESGAGGDVQYGKFAYAGCAVQLVEPEGGSGHTLNVGNSIFRNNDRAVYVKCLNSQAICQISNCLFVGSGMAIYAESVPEYGGYISLSVRNCTFDQVGTAVVAQDDMYESTYDVKYNVFANTGCGVAYYQNNPDEHPDFLIDRNGLYNVSTFVSPDDIECGNYTVDDPPPPYTSPFASNANGSYYLRNGSPFRNYGDCPAGGLSGKTTTAATTATGRIKTAEQITSSEFWSRIQRDGDTPDDVMLDLGYHYDPVDIIIECSGGVFVTGFACVHGVPGLTVAFSHERQWPAWQGLAASDDGRLDMRGTGPEPIRFASTLACGDKIGSRSCEAIPGRIWLFGGVAVCGVDGEIPAGSGQFEYCTSEHAFNGLSLGGSTPVVSGCRFDDCMYGIVHRSDSTCNRTIKNCLFRDTWSSAIDATTTWPLWVFNSTFYRGQIGVECTTGTSVTIRNSIFDDNTTGIYKKASLSVTESYNCFWLNAANANFSLVGQGNLTQDPKFVNTTVPDLYERFYLNQGPSTTSPCVLYGNPNDTRFLTTALDKDLDTSPVDIGYHYPVRGHLRVVPNYFFEFEDGEPFYPISATNQPRCVEDSSPSLPGFYTSTLPAYLETVARHGVNTMRVTPYGGSTHLQEKELYATSGTLGHFRQGAVEEYDKYFDALEAKGLSYMVVAYDYPSLTNDALVNYLRNCIYFNINQGSVPWTLSGNFFLEDEPSTMGRRAREHFQYALSQFVESRYQSSRWFGRKGLVGWTLFSEPDRAERQQAWDSPLSQREDWITDWSQKMLSFMGTTETAKLGSRRLHCLDVWNLRRFKYYDEDIPKDQPQYLDVSENDYIDYHLNTRYENTYDRAKMYTDYPTDPFTPMQQFLGVKGEFTTAGCSLPEVIDHYRDPASPRRAGFFSSGFDLFGWTKMPGSDIFYVPPRRRFLSDCYHNYVWLAFATGSVGGPIPCEMPPTLNVKPYDLSGVTYLSPKGVVLNTYTDEVLDSMLSLNRFTSVVQWKLADDSYQPVRVHHQSGDTTITLLEPTTGQQLSQNDWLWTAASDRQFTVGWIVRNCPRNYLVPESEDALTTAPAPRLRIQNLVQVPLELVWFDDHLGQIVGTRAYTSSTSLTVQVPNTEGTNGFARSIAFVMQPAGLTPNKYFEALPSHPNHLICQIEVSDRGQYEWYEEYEQTISGTRTFTAVMKPPIANLANWKFTWQFGNETSTVFAQNWIQHYCAASSEFEVTVDIYDPSGKRVAGDRTTVYAH